MGDMPALASGLADVATGLSVKLTAVILLVAATMAGETRLQVALVPAALFLGGAFYVGRGLRALRRIASPPM